MATDDILQDAMLRKKPPQDGKLQREKDYFKQKMLGELKDPDEVYSHDHNLSQQNLQHQVSIFGANSNGQFKQ